MSEILKELLAKSDLAKLQLNEWIENKAFDEMWKKLVPAQGEAKTPFGEAVRALGRLEYECNNNGNCNVETAGKGYYFDLYKHLGAEMKKLHAPEEAMEAYRGIAPKPGMGLKHPERAHNGKAALERHHASLGGPEKLPASHPDRAKYDNYKREIYEHYKKEQSKFKEFDKHVAVLKSFLVASDPQESK